jgi:hypothetical protein
VFFQQLAFAVELGEVQLLLYPGSGHPGILEARRRMQNPAWILLAIWLIATGLVPLLDIRIPSGDTLLGLLAIAAGVLMLLGQKKFKYKGNLGMLLLSIWLIATGLLPLLKLNFPVLGIIMAVLAVAAGVLLLLKR